MPSDKTIQMDTTHERLYEHQQNRKKTLRNKTIIIALLVLIMMLFRACSLPAEELPDDGPPLFSGEVDPNSTPGLDKMTYEEIQAALNDKVEKGMMNIHMLMEPVFPSGTEEGKIGFFVELQNREPQAVEIIRMDTGEVIWKTGIVPVGFGIDKDKLDVDLDPGYYPCIARFMRIDIETKEILGIAEHEIRVAVLG